MKNKPLKPFTKAQEDFVRSQYLTKPIKTMAAELGIHPGRIIRFLKREGLEIPLEIRKKRRSISQFKKGHKTFNKGMKQSDWMSPEDLKKVKKHWYKKGNVPHNVHAEGDGAISIRKDNRGIPIKHIRVSLGIWEPLHRYNYEKKHGPIPEGYMLSFKDGNTLNTEDDNIELITMIENMYRNAKYNYPKEVIPSMTLVKQIENKLTTLKTK
ncbi:MAG TPA: HNH endonuclease signature motif containing protein [Dysgonamonadaceae bacterium]|nr:HNH endonuclease signature motif containing protein [Dysgonamonadaceae bacterium]